MHHLEGADETTARQLNGIIADLLVDFISVAASAPDELELELIQTQMTQKPMLRAEGECACVAQKACAKIRGRGRPGVSKRERGTCGWCPLWKCTQEGA